jgi:hypothetical protein
MVVDGCETGGAWTAEVEGGSVRDGRSRQHGIGYLRRPPDAGGRTSTSTGPSPLRSSAGANLTWSLRFPRLLQLAGCGLMRRVPLRASVRDQHAAVDLILISRAASRADCETAWNPRSGLGPKPTPGCRSVHIARCCDATALFRSSFLALELPRADLKEGLRWAMSMTLKPNPARLPVNPTPFLRPSKRATTICPIEKPRRTLTSTYVLDESSRPGRDGLIRIHILP